jgi:preprotein translocase subunit SecA
MRLFGSDRIASVMNRLGLEEGQELTHPLLTRSIERAQKRVEERNFSMRKHTLEYDDVMNKQREVIYAYRNQALENDNLKELVMEMVDEVLDAKIEQWIPKGSHPERWDTDGLQRWFIQAFPMAPPITSSQDIASATEWKEKLTETLQALYETKEKHEGEATVRMMEQFLLLTTIDKQWKEHLYNMDGLREGIYLRAYGQVDPLLAYKQEGYKAFAEMMGSIKDDVVTTFFRMTIAVPSVLMRPQSRSRARYVHDAVTGYDAMPELAQPQEAMTDAPSRRQESGTPLIPVKRDVPKVGRNDSCPCGSGKKYKKCCGA